MAQSEERSRLSVFVDLDETLVFQSSFEFHPARKELEEAGVSPYKLSTISANQLNEVLPEGSRAINSAGRIVVVTRRPGAVEFLQKVKALVGQICCLTMGRTSHQRRVLEAADLAGLFEVVVGRDKYSALVPQHDKNWMLIDDLDPKDPSCTAKLHGLGVVSDRALRVQDMRSDEELERARERVVIVPPFNGKKGDDGLARVWPEVDSKIRTLKGNFAGPMEG